MVKCCGAFANRRSSSRRRWLPRTRATADEYRRLISASPDDWVFQAKSRPVLQELDDPAGATESWRQVEKAILQDVEAPLQLNLILTKEGKLAEAAEEYLKALDLDRNAV